MASPPLPITLYTATAEDIPRLAHIGHLAFLTDRHSAMKIQGQRPGTLDRGMAAGPASYVSQPRARVIKAVTPDRKIAGWICWASRGDDLVLNTLPTLLTAADHAASTWHAALFAPGHADGPDPSIPNSSRIAAEEAMTSAHFSAWMARIMPPGARCMYIGGIQVDPAYQGRGVGSALLRWGLEQADREGVFAWIHSSEAGWPVMERHGFEAEMRLVIELDEWAVGRPPSEGQGAWVGEERWGRYTLTYGLRQPRETT